MKKALITGITGQDGSYLLELLLSKGYEVHGLVRRSSTVDYDSRNDFHVHYGDMADSACLTRIIKTVQPDEIYNLAAQSHVRISFEMPEYTVDINAVGVLRILEAIKDFIPTCRMYQASSSEMFGDVPSPQNEDTVFKPQSPYACAKVYAYHQVVNFRKSYRLFLCNGIAFNHESPRRGENFVTRKVARAAARIRKGLQHELRLGRLDTERDWGWAPDYVLAMWMMLQHSVPDDFVIATGELHTVKELVEETFSYLGLDWEKYVIHDDTEVRPSDVPSLLGDTSKIHKTLGWEPTVKFHQLVRYMVDAELDIIDRNQI